MRTRLQMGGAIVLAVALAIAAGVAGATSNTSASTQTVGSERCQFGGSGNRIRHVIYLQFDNTHLWRDRQQFESDLEQMPHLMNFLRENGTLSDNEHTILISHTAGGILTSLTGLYPDRMGQGVSNSYGFFRPNGSVGFSSSFKYWTDIVDGGNPATDPPTPPADTNYNMVNGDSGSAKNAPAPWVPWTRVGCDVGNVSTANAVLENNNSIVFAAGPTTLAAAAVAGATNIRVGSVSGFTVGMRITIDTGPSAESAVIALGPVSIVILIPTVKPETLPTLMFVAPATAAAASVVGPAAKTIELLFSSTAFAVETFPTSQPTRVHGTQGAGAFFADPDRKSTRLNSSH